MPRTDSTLPGILIQESDSSGLITLAQCSGNPGTLATTASKYAIGCLITDTTTGKTYCNQGSVAVPSWVQASRNLITVTAKTTTTTLTAAEVVGGLITANQGGGAGATYTLPAGALLQAALPAGFAVGDSFLFSVCNISTNASEDATIQGGAGTTLVGNGVVASNAAATDESGATFRVVKTGNEAFSFYRIS